MATIQEFLESAKADINSGACDRAIAICQHVLQRYPKHLEAHCLLAEAFREQGDAVTAEDLFLRVLSADPENLIARWALSIIHEGRGERDSAAGHLRIALEVRPDHPELRKEVVQICGDRAKPTGGGLARLYVRGGLFDRASAEFRAALGREPQRLDLLVGLAEALLRGGRYQEATEVCQRVLEDSPDCLKALLIAGFVGIAQERPVAERERQYWQAAQALDPENQMARQMAYDMGITLPEDRIALLIATVELPEPEVGSLMPEIPTSVAAATVGADLVDEELDLSAFEPVAPVAEDELLGVAPPEPIAEAEVPVAEQEEELPAYEPEIEELARMFEKADQEPAVAQAMAPPGGPAVEPGTAPSAGFGADDGGAGTEAAYAEGARGDELGAPGHPAAGTGEAPSADGRGEAGQEIKWEEWADLLNEDISLDPDAEARLSAALTEMVSGQERPASTNGSSVAGRGDGASTGQDMLAEDAPDKASPAGLQAPLKALEADPDDHRARLSRAQGYQGARRPDAAVAEYRTLLRDAPEMAGEIADGLRDLLRDDPNHAEGHRALGDAYMKIGRFQQAIDEYNYALSIERAGR